MKAAAISAVLIASVLDGAEAEGQTAEVMPWAARLETSVFGYRGDGGTDWSHQGSVYPSITVQPSRYLWLHGGLRLRETAVMGFANPYREVGSFKVAAITQILPGALYMTGAGNYVPWPGRLRLSDSLALSESMNGYSPFPEPAFLSMPGALGGLLLRLSSERGETLLGANYYRPGKIDPFDTLAFQPASHVSFSAQFRWKEGRHAVRLLSALYGEETTDLDIASHREGPLFLAGYRFLGAGNRWGGDVGGTFKAFDFNRRVRLAVDPEPAALNDNVQKAWVRVHRNFQIRKQIWQAGLGGMRLWSVENVAEGYEVRAEGGWRLPLEKHLWEIQCHALSALVGDMDYLGGGFNFVYSLRRISAALPMDPLAQ